MFRAMFLMLRTSSVVVWSELSAVILSGQPHDALYLAWASWIIGSASFVIRSRSRFPPHAVIETAAMVSETVIRQLGHVMFLVQGL
jgi:hypothetical protein